MIIKGCCDKIKIQGGVIIDISKIDKNFKTETKIEREGLTFYDIDEPPFKVYGVYREGDHYVRLPADVAKSVSDGVFSLHTHTAGGKNVYYIDGMTLFAPEMREAALVDNLHPNDVGFLSMANVMGEKLKEIFKI